MNTSSFRQSFHNVLPTGFSASDRIFFFKNLAIMISSDLTMMETLRVLKEHYRRRRVKSAIDDMLRHIESGKQLSAALAMHPKYFQDYIVRTIRAGEIAGKLSSVARRIALDLEARYRTMQKIRAALVYPILVVVGMFIVMFTMSFTVLPGIAALYQDMGQPLPVLTSVILHGSFWARNHPFILLYVILALIVGFILALRYQRSRFFLHSFFLRLPIFGGLIQHLNIARFFRSTELLFSSGIPLATSIEIVRKTLRNSLYQYALLEIQPVLLQGMPLSKALQKYPRLFPMQTLRIVEVGERTGKLEETLMNITSYYEDELRQKTETLQSLIEPVLLVFVGIGVGVIALSTFLPLYQASNLF